MWSHSLAYLFCPTSTSGVLDRVWRGTQILDVALVGYRLARVPETMHQIAGSWS